MSSDLLVRVQQRIETDVPTEELQNLIDEGLAAIEERIGPAVDPAQPVTIDMLGRRRKLDIVRPIDTAHTLTIVEHVLADPDDIEAGVYADDWWPQVSDTPTTLDSNDYHVWNNGRTVERIATGTHPRTRWGSRVVLTYVPVDDGNQRQEVVIKLVQLALQYEGVIERTVGDIKTTYGMRSSTGPNSPLVYQDERDRLIDSLRPRRGLMLR